MKRKIKTVSNILIASAAVLALIIGFSLGAISDFSRSIIDRIFPVTYDVEFINGGQGTLHSANVVFNGETASVSSDTFKGTVDMNNAIFSCTDETARSQNTIRHGLLTMLVSSAAFSFAASVAWFGVEVRSLARRSVKRRSVSAVTHKEVKAVYLRSPAYNAA
jgi:hypothetical protein